MTTTINGTTGISAPAVTITTPQSMVRLNTGNGYGSTNTKIRRFTNIVTNQGTDISYVDSATLGGTFTINTNGVYAISYSEMFSTGSNFGITLNSSGQATAIASTPIAEWLVISTTSANGFCGAVSWSGYLPAGSVIRPHTSGDTGSFPVFTIARVA